MKILTKQLIILGAVFAIVGSIILVPVSADGPLPYYPLLTNIQTPVKAGRKLKLTAGCYTGAANYHSAVMTVTSTNATRNGVKAYASKTISFGMLTQRSNLRALSLAPKLAKVGDRVRVNVTCSYSRVVSGKTYTTSKSTSSSFKVKVNPALETNTSNSETETSASTLLTKELGKDGKIPGIIYSFEVATRTSGYYVLVIISTLGLLASASYFGYYFVLKPRLING